MTTEQIEYVISRRYDLRSHIIVPNISWGALNHEADLLVVRKSGHCIEYEIKRSFSDYKKDFEKSHNHYDAHIKEFYYAFPAELWYKREGDILSLLPDHAGVIIIFNDIKSMSRIMKQAKEMKSIPMNANEIYNIARLGTMRIWSLKKKLIELKNK